MCLDGKRKKRCREERGRKEEEEEEDEKEERDDQTGKEIKRKKGCGYGEMRRGEPTEIMQTAANSIEVHRANNRSFNLFD